MSSTETIADLIDFDQFLQEEFILRSTLSEEQYKVARTWYEALPAAVDAKPHALFEENSYLEITWHFSGSYASSTINRKGKVIWEIYDFYGGHFSYSPVFPDYQDFPTPPEHFITHTSRIRQGAQNNGP